MVKVFAREEVGVLTGELSALLSRPLGEWRGGVE